MRRIAALTADEQAVLAGMARGLTSQQIADELDLSLRTVQFRRASLMKSLQTKTSAEVLSLVEQAQWSLN